jgi:hypothetical protein
LQLFPIVILLFSLPKQMLAGDEAGDTKLTVRRIRRFRPPLHPKLPDLMIPARSA